MDNEMTACGSTQNAPCNHVSPDELLMVERLPEQALKTVAGYQGKIARYLFEIACLDGLPQFRAKRALPSQLLRYFARIMDLYDESTQFLLSHLRRCGVTVQCGPECAHCCYNMPTNISIMELIYLYYGVRQNRAANRFFRRCLEVDELWSGISRRFSNRSWSLHERDRDREKALKSYQALERPCPFLQLGTCQIYPYRPFACRMHFSLSPPHWCRPSHFQHAHAVAFNLEQGESVTEALEKLDKRFELDLSDLMIRGLLDLTVNVMEFDDIRWLN